jgi:hypothetical protein
VLTVEHHHEQPVLVRLGVMVIEEVIRIGEPSSRVATSRLRRCGHQITTPGEVRCTSSQVRSTGEGEAPWEVTHKRGENSCAVVIDIGCDPHTGNRLQGGLSLTSVQRHYRLLHQVFRRAVHGGSADGASANGRRIDEQHT